LQVYIEPKIGNLKQSIRVKGMGDIRRDGYRAAVEIPDFFSDITRVRFDIFLVEDENGYKKVRGMCENLRLTENNREGDDKAGILEVAFKDDLPEIWKVELDSDHVKLTVNSRFINRENIKGKYGAFILPAVVREILIHKIFIDGVEDFDDFGEWQDFIDTYISRCERPSVISVNEEGFEESKTEVLNFIDCIVTGFIGSTNLRDIIGAGDRE